MPKYRSEGGVWHPVTTSTKKELDAQGLATLGQPANQDPNLAVEAPVENADLIEESGDDVRKAKLVKVKKKRGVKRRTVRTKAGG